MPDLNDRIRRIMQNPPLVVLLALLAAVGLAFGGWLVWKLVQAALGVEVTLIQTLD